MQQQSATPTAALFTIPVLIWGSTWFAITFQLGTVAPIFSVSYRFMLAGILLIGYCFVRKIPLRFTRKQHGRILLQALCLFGFNYWLTYESEQYIASGLVALIFSLVIFFNIGFGNLILKNPIKKQVVWGAILGLLGTFLVFYPDLIKLKTNIDAPDQTLLGIALCASGVVVASLGNIASAYNQRQSLPVISTNAVGMLYGGCSMFLMALVTGNTPTFEPTWAYAGSLLYLAVFGSIIAFGFYLTLIGKIGPDKAAYALVVTPVIAIGISILFEGYQLTWITSIGIVLLLTGILVALKKRSQGSGTRGEEEEHG